MSPPFPLRSPDARPSRRPVSEPYVVTVTTNVETATISLVAMAPHQRAARALGDAAVHALEDEGSPGVGSKIQAFDVVPASPVRAREVVSKRGQLTGVAIGLVFLVGWCAVIAAVPDRRRRRVSLSASASGAQRSTTEPDFPRVGPRAGSYLPDLPVRRPLVHAARGTSAAATHRPRIHRLDAELRRTCSEPGASPPGVMRFRCTRDGRRTGPPAGRELALARQISARRGAASRACGPPTGARRGGRRRNGRPAWCGTRWTPGAVRRRTGPRPPSPRGTGRCTWRAETNMHVVERGSDEERDCGRRAHQRLRRAYWVPCRDGSSRREHHRDREHEICDQPDDTHLDDRGAGSRSRGSGSSRGCMLPQPRPNARWRPEVRPDGIVVGGAIAHGGDLAAVRASELRQRRAECARATAPRSLRLSGQRRAARAGPARGGGSRRAWRTRRSAPGSRSSGASRTCRRRAAQAASPYRIAITPSSSAMSATSAIGSAIESMRHRLQRPPRPGRDPRRPEAVDRLGRRRPETRTRRAARRARRR